MQSNYLSYFVQQRQEYVFLNLAPISLYSMLKARYFYQPTKPLIRALLYRAKTAVNTCCCPTLSFPGFGTRTDPRIFYPVGLGPFGPFG